MSKIINGIAFDCLDLEGRLDWLDGWHEAGDLGFKSRRDPDVTRKHLVGRDPVTKLSIYDDVPARKLMECGRQERQRIREARGV